MTKEEFLKRLDADGIQELRVIWYDLNCVPRSRVFQRESVPDVLQKGVNFVKAMISFTSFDSFPSQPMFNAAGGDFFAVPVLSTYSPVPYRPGVGRVLTELVEDDGSPFAGCPRHLLKQVVEQYRARGIHCLVAFEPEAYLFKKTDTGYVPADSSKCFVLDGLDQQASLLRDIVTGLRTMGVEVEKISSEYGPGQYEINLRPSEPVKACEDLLALKEVFRAVAQDHGYVGTFMPKPFDTLPGSGLHVHISLWNGDGSNALDDPRDEYGLSALGRSVVAGMLAHARALTAIGSPIINSYKRLLPGSWAPAHAAWGFANRAALIRVPEKKRRARVIEYRGADGACNPYVFLAALLAAGLDGIENCLPCPEPVNEDVGAVPPEAFGRPDVKLLPRTAAEAFAALEEDRLMAQVLGEVIYREFLNIKKWEYEVLSRHVSDRERAVYMELI